MKVKILEINSGDPLYKDCNKYYGLIGDFTPKSKIFGHWYNGVLIVNTIAVSFLAVKVFDIVANEILNKSEEELGIENIFSVGNTVYAIPNVTWGNSTVWNVTNNSAITYRIR